MNQASPARKLATKHSGDAYEIHRQAALQAGPDAYVPNPDIDALIDAVQKLPAGQEWQQRAKRIFLRVTLMTVSGLDILEDSLMLSVNSVNSDNALLECCATI